MQKLFSFIVVIAFFGLMVTSASAHSGCCSWHGGVRADGCGCNDGSPLSSTCAPYYSCTAPQQNTAPANTSSDTTTNTYVAPVYVASTVTPTPVPPTDTPTPLPTATPTLQPTVIPTSKLFPTVVPTTAVLGAKTASNGGVAILLVLLAPIIIVGSLWWGRRLAK